jgi:hypothetical protein
VYCVLEKRRHFNSTYVEKVSINISNLEHCDRLDSQYTAFKTDVIKNETEANIEIIKTDLTTKIKQIERNKAETIRTAKCFGWLAIVMMILMFLINVLIDSQKLILYLKNFVLRKE